jgi:hypothetical protein
MTTLNNVYVVWLEREPQDRSTPILGVRQSARSAMRLCDPNLRQTWVRQSIGHWYYVTETGYRWHIERVPYGR